MEKISRSYSNDPILTELANGVRYLPMEISQEEQHTFHQKMREGELKNVSFFADFRTYRVRIYLGGKQRTIGITDNGYKAARFADMARLFFWPYRLRDARPPGEGDMNFTLADTQHELDHNEVATRLLERIKDHLESFGDLKIVSRLEEDQRAERKRFRESRRTVRSEMSDFLRDQATQTVRLDETLAELQRTNRHMFEEIKTALLRLDERLAAINAKKD